jgi:hypothetical protein
MLVCDWCGEEIQDERTVCLLRDDYALPEEPTFSLHARCAEAFQANHPARWHRIPLASPEASWCL